MKCFLIQSAQVLGSALFQRRNELSVARQATALELSFIFVQAARVRSTNIVARSAFQGHN